MAKKSTRLEALHDIFEENGISPDTIELNDSLIQDIKKHAGLQASFLYEAPFRRHHHDRLLRSPRKCRRMGRDRKLCQKEREMAAQISGAAIWDPDR